MSAIGDQLWALIGKTVIIAGNSAVLLYSPSRQNCRQAGDPQGPAFRPRDVERIEPNNEIVLKEEFWDLYFEQLYPPPDPSEYEYEGEPEPGDYDPADPDADFPGSGEE